MFLQQEEASPNISLGQIGPKMFFCAQARFRNGLVSAGAVFVVRDLREELDQVRTVRRRTKVKTVMDLFLRHLKK